MTPEKFPEANSVFGPPENLTEKQVRPIDVFIGKIEHAGALDGENMIVTAWRPSEEDLARLNAGGLVFFTAVGILPPHLLSTTFERATAIT